MDNYTLTTPALLFPAISLLMLAYTNRFITLAGLIRDLYQRHQQIPQVEILDQIINLQKRIEIIRRMQICGAISFASCVISMLALISSHQVNRIISIIFFIFGLLMLLISLLFLIQELNISVKALQIQLLDIKDKKKNHPRTKEGQD